MCSAKICCIEYTANCRTFILHVLAFDARYICVEMHILKANGYGFHI